jgi:hypothetical protein
MLVALQTPQNAENAVHQADPFHNDARAASNSARSRTGVEEDKMAHYLREV